MSEASCTSWFFSLRSDGQYYDSLKVRTPGNRPRVRLYNCQWQSSSSEIEARDKCNLIQTTLQWDYSECLGKDHGLLRISMITGSTKNYIVLFSLSLFFLAIELLGPNNAFIRDYQASDYTLHRRCCPSSASAHSPVRIFPPLYQHTNISERRNMCPISWRSRTP